MSYVLGRRRSTSLFPSSVWYLTGSLCCVILMSTHQSELFWLRFSYFGVTCLHVVKRTPAPWLWWRVPGGLFFLLGSTSAEEPWNILRDGCFLYLCPHVHLSRCFLIFFTKKISRPESLPRGGPLPAAAEVHAWPCCWAAAALLPEGGNSPLFHTGPESQLGFLY